MSLGVHFAIDDHTAARLLAAADDAEVGRLVEEIEMELIGVDYYDTDKAWDAIHRSLTDGTLSYGSGTYPLNVAVLGGEPLHEGDDYIVSLIDAEQVRDVAKALEDVTGDVLAAGYHRIDPADYGPNFGPEDFEYTWSNFTGMADFFRRSAERGKHVIFTVGL